MIIGRRIGGLGWPNVLVGLLVVMAGCVTSTPDDPSGASQTTRSGAVPDGSATGEAESTTDSGSTPAHVTAVPSKHPSLDSRLFDLLNAENRTAFAASRGLDLGSDGVLVVVELRGNRSLPAEFEATVTTRHESLVQARIPLDRLVALADHANVSYVRPPRTPATGSPSEENSPDDTSIP